MNVQFSLCRLDLEIAYEDFFLDPMILRPREANTQWLIHSSLSQRVDTSQAFFRRLPSEVVEIVCTLKTNQQIQDALLCTREKTNAGYLNLYNIFDYYYSQDGHEEKTFPEGASACECFDKWEKDNFPYPCQIDGMLQWDDVEDKVIRFFDDDASLTPFRPDKDSQFFYAMWKNAAISYNELVIKLYDKGFVYYPAYLKYQHIYWVEPSLSRKTIKTYL